MPSPLRHFGFRWFVVAPLMFVVFVASFLFVTFHLVRASATPKRDQVVAELDAAEPGWRVHDLTAARNAKLPPPEQNAAELAYQAEQKLPKAYREWNKQLIAGPWHGDLTNPHLPEKAHVADVRTHLAKARESVELARSVRHVTDGGFPLVFKEPLLITTLLEKQQNLRQVMGLLSYDAAVRAYDRDDTGALESCLAILAVARGIGDEPTLISQLIRMAGVAICVSSTERALCWGADFNDATLAELDKAFEKESNESRLLYGLRGERAVFFRISENIDSGAFNADELNSVGLTVPTPLGLYVQSQIPEEQAVALELFSKMIAAAGKPPGKERSVALKAAGGECEDTIKRGWVGPMRRHILLGLLMPAIFKISEADTRTVASLNAARVAIACERHRQKTGAYPTTLDELPKELLPEVPNDPFTGKPILYKKLDDGAVAYSAGFDGVDDGAKKLHPMNEKGNDIGFRLWTLEHRRKPPQAKTQDDSAPAFRFDLDDKPKPGVPTAPPPLSPWVKKE
jgi:hypothetical protein